MTDLASNPVSRRVGSTGMAVYPVAVNGSVFGWSVDADEAADVLDRFTADGGNLISTADHYSGGRSEVMIGSWLRRHDRRDELVISTKVGRHPDAPGLSAASIRAAAEASRERLQVDTIDLLGLDGDDPVVPLEESLTAVAELIARGAVGHLAVSGMSPQRVREAIRIARRLELPGVSAVFASYNLLDREPYESGIAPVAVGGDLGVLALLPLAGGFLRADGSHPYESHSGRERRRAGRRGDRVLGALRDIAWEVDSTPGCVALAWLLSKPMLVAPIVRVQDGAALLDLLPAARLQLPAEHLARLDDLA